MDRAAEFFKVFLNWIWHNIIFINLICSVVIIFFQRRDPKSVWGWLLLMYFLPVVGFIFYILVGQDYSRTRMFRVKGIEDELNSIIRRQEDIILTKKYDPIDPSIERYSDLVLYNLESSGAVYTDDNEIEIFTDGKEKFSALIDDLKKAEKYIHFQYYIIRDDELFDRIKEVLIEKVHEGVEVRVLYDSMGCRGMKSKVWKELKNEGIATGEFFPALLGRLQLRLNYRNHRKIVVIDGKTAYVGGFNVGREYLGLDEKKFGYWRDTHLRIRGGAVSFLQMRFLLDWNYTARENLLKDDSYFNSREERKGHSGVQIVSSGPDSRYKNIRNNYLKLIEDSKESIFIQTPYFVPDETILEALKVAALSGIDVRIIFPCKPDHPFVYWATYSYIGDMIRAGAKCYTYDNGFIHTKGLISDGKVMSYGTANMDVRSFSLNFEVNVTVYDPEVTARMQEIFLKDLASCTEITSYIYGRRKWPVRVKEQICRLFSPIL